MPDNSTDSGANGGSGAHVRIPNRLLEALLIAGLSDRQFKIVLAIIRVTLGWTRETVEASQPELADWCGMAFGGMFREALTELTRNGVIEVSRGGGPAKSIFRLQPNHEKWGRFAVHPDAIRARFGARPTQQDRAFTPDRVQADQPPDADTQSARSRAGATPPHGRTPRPPTGVGTGSNPPDPNVLQPPTDIDRQDIHTTSSKDSLQRDSNADAGSSDYALKITVAANLAISNRWNAGRESTRPLIFGNSTQLASELIADGISLQVAIDAITSACERSRLPTPPTSVNYFANAIRDRANVQRQHSLDRSTDLGRSAPGLTRISATGPTAPAYIPVPDETARTSAAELDAHYDAERDRAIDAFAADPENAETLDQLRASAIADNALTPTSMRERAINTDFRLAVARSAGFPDRDAWKSARGQAE